MRHWADEVVVVTLPSEVTGRAKQGRGRRRGLLWERRRRRRRENRYIVPVNTAVDLILISDVSVCRRVE